MEAFFAEAHQAPFVQDLSSLEYFRVRTHFAAKKSQRGDCGHISHWPRPQSRTVRPSLFFLLAGQRVRGGAIDKIYTWTIF